MCSTRSFVKPGKKKTRKPYTHPVRLCSQISEDFFTGLSTISVSSTLSRDSRLRGGCHLSGLYIDTHFILGFFSSTKEGPEHRQTTAKTARVNETLSNTFFACWHTKVIFYTKDNVTTRARRLAREIMGSRDIFGYQDGNMWLGNDAGRMRNCNGLVDGLMSLVVCVFGSGWEKGNIARRTSCCSVS